MKAEMNLDLTSPEQITLEERVTLFKKDPEKMKEVIDFIDELIQKAKCNAEFKLKEREKIKINGETEQGLKRRLGNRARGFIVRIFEAICNCTHTSAAVARPTTPSKK